MSSTPIRDPAKDHLLTPENSAFIIIDYQPVQVSSIRSMNQDEMVFNIVSTARQVALARGVKGGVVLVSVPQERRV